MEEFIDLHSKGLTRYEIFESHGLPVEFREYLLAKPICLPLPFTAAKENGNPSFGIPVSQ